MKFRILTSCTGEKLHKPKNQLVLDDFNLPKAVLKKREGELKEYLTPAGTLYTGQQHVRLMRGVQFLREKTKIDVEVQILSAGYGLIPEDRKIVPYEVTFQGMKKKPLREWAETLDIPNQFRVWVKEKADLTIILLGDNYLDACGLSKDMKFGGPTLLFCGTGMAKKLPEFKNVRVVPISNPEAKRFSCGLVGLKGELADRIFKGFATKALSVSKLKDESFDILEGLDKTVPESKTKTASVQNPSVDYVISIPKVWWEHPHRKKLRYFIPEWDDLVDPDYDFLLDSHSGGSGSWGNEVYAHQMYPEPNYDGILISRAVAEKSKSKGKRINALGVHRMVRVPREFPIMGDCGAFDYIMEDVPPYSTEDVIDYYTRLDFDYGVSVDHLIVKATEHQKKERYQLTIDNAADFLRQHKKAKLKWTPIGAVQGWDPDAYAKAAGQYAKMGYKYIGLGGLVRSTTKGVLHILEAVRKEVPADMQIHLFGIARPKAIPHLIRAGANSIDSASHLRRAWLGAGQNYFTLDGRSYTAIRIPQAGKSFRAKRMVSEGRVSAQQIEKLEQNCLRVVRAFDNGNASITETLDTLSEYDNLVDEGRKDIRPLLEKLLTDAPWKHCPCEICQKDGVEVVIFRGNNRNRRRGFHNTYIFYKQLMDAVNLDKLPVGMRSSQDPAQPELFESKVI